MSAKLLIPLEEDFPISYAWLGNLKNADLARQFEGGEGFWKSFADGVEHIQVEHALMKVRLRE